MQAACMAMMLAAIVKCSICPSELVPIIISTIHAGLRNFSSSDIEVSSRQLPQRFIEFNILLPVSNH